MISLPFNEAFFRFDGIFFQIRGKVTRILPVRGRKPVTNCITPKIKSEVLQYGPIECTEGFNTHTTPQGTYNYWETNGKPGFCCGCRIP